MEPGDTEEEFRLYPAAIEKVPDCTTTPSQASKC